ncbi:hypothetical protein [Rubrivivax gelatinosus]|nr:hypothetical protein [Rubrivivax gelatinosus]
MAEDKQALSDMYPALAEQKPQHPIEQAIERYLLSLRNIGQTITIVMPHLQKWQIAEINKCEKKLSHFLPNEGAGPEPHTVQLDSARDFAELTSTLRQLEELHTNKSLPVLARSLFMQMFCEFDAFMGSLLKAVYIKNQELLKGIAKEITLRELFAFRDLDAVKRAMLDKEIETFRRDSYVEQFASLEKKFQITLRKFDEWAEFVELGQRRNVFTHNDGTVSDQYLTVCEREGLQFQSRPLLGSTLQVDAKYFGRALTVMSKVGYMIGHTLWAKVFPGEHDQLHESLNDRLYQALEHKRWKTATELGSFALSDPMRKNASDIQVRVRAINCAIAYKFAGDDASCKRLLNSFDWSASYRDFKLAILVLTDEFDNAVKMMERIGRSGEILEQSSYYTWPLFNKFRERPEFYVTYEKIYGEPYLAQVSTDGKSAMVGVHDTGMRSDTKKAEFQRAKTDKPSFARSDNGTQRQSAATSRSRRKSASAKRVASQEAPSK